MEHSGRAVLACGLLSHWTLVAGIILIHVKLKVKWSRHRPGVAQRMGRGIALLFHDRGIRRGWVFSSTPRPHFTPRKDQVPVLQEAGWAPGPVWMGGKPRPHRDSIPDRQDRNHSLYRLSYRAHNFNTWTLQNKEIKKLVLWFRTPYGAWLCVYSLMCPCAM